MIEDKLKQLAKSYKITRQGFFARQKELVEGFDLTMEDRGKVAFGIVEPAKPELLKFTEKANNDLILNQLNDRIKDVFLEGGVIILKEILKQGIKIPGYNLQTLINQAQENYEEIEDLILGLFGHENMQIKDDKLFFEFPARHYLFENEDIITLIDLWITAIEVFDKD